MRRLPSVTGLQHAGSTGSCVSRNMASRMFGAFVLTEKSSSTASLSTSTPPWPASQSDWLNLRPVGPSATVRLCSVPSLTGAMNYENQSARAMDLGTTLRVAPRVHSPNKNRPERNENCVTHAVGLKCYLCRRLLNPSLRGSDHAPENQEPPGLGFIDKSLKCHERLAHYLASAFRSSRPRKSINGCEATAVPLPPHALLAEPVAC